MLAAFVEVVEEKLLTPEKAISFVEFKNRLILSPEIVVLYEKSRITRFMDDS